MRALQPRLPAQPDGSLAHLATLTPNDWISIAAQAQPNASMSDIERVAGNLGGAIELQHPSLAFKTKLDAGVVDIRNYPAAKVADFPVRTLISTCCDSRRAVPDRAWS